MSTIVYQLSNNKRTKEEYMKALVLSGGMAQAYLATELKNRGITVLLADQNEKAPAVKYADKFIQVSALDVDAIRDIAKKEEVSFVISVCADQMLLVAAQVCEELGMPCYIDYKTAKDVSNKELMKDIFVKHDIPTSKHTIAATLALDDVKDMRYPLVVKPVDAYSSRGVKKVHNLDELTIAFENAVDISRTSTAVIEEFVGGDELSVDIYVEDGVAHLLCIRVLDKIPGTDDFIICRGRYPAILSNETIKNIQEVAQKITYAFKLTNSPMLIQMKVDSEKISVIEFCARTGGGIKYRLLPIVSGFDPVKAVLDLTLGAKPRFEKNALQAYIFDEFVYCNPGVISHFESFEDLLNEGVIDHYDQFKLSGHSIGSIKSSGDRVAYFSVRADTMDELEKLHGIANDRIKVVSTDGKDLIKHDIIEGARLLL